MWHGCCHGEAPCSGNVLSIIEGTQPSFKILYMPANVLWNLSTANIIVIGFLSGNCAWVEGEGKPQGRSWKKNQAYHSWCQKEEAENDRGFKTRVLGSFKEIKTNYAPNAVTLYCLCNFHTLKQRERQKISYMTSFRRLNEGIIQFKYIW